MIKIEINDQTPIGTVIFLCLPPKAGGIESMKQLAEWYRDHPGKCAIVTNVGAAA